MAQSPSHKSQLYAVNLLTGWSLREIEELFAGNEVTTAADHLNDQRWPIGSSVRRDLAARYHAALDMRNHTDRARLLRVYDDILSQAVEDQLKQELSRLLRRDEVRFEAEHQIAQDELAIPDPGPFDDLQLPDFSLVTDPEVLREHAVRMQRALGNRDPADALLAARELLETVCKLVLENYDDPPPKNASLGQMYAQTAEHLGLRAKAIQGDDVAPKAAKQVLQGLQSVAEGLGELRTRVGRGHGRTSTSPARQRHAELGTSAAATLALFVLDTWHERRT